MNQIVVGKRIPIGAAVSGLVTFGFSIWNMTHPEMQFSMGEVAAFAIPLTFLIQVIVVNCLGVTNARPVKK